MEADDLRADILDHSAHLRVEGQPKRAAVPGLDAELVIKGPEQGAPSAVVHAFGHAVAEEIEVERPAGALAHLGDLRPHLVGTEQRARQRTERTTLDCRGAQVDSAGRGHRRLDDRVLAPDAVKKPAVAPAYHSPLLGIEVHGSAGASAAPFCRSSIEISSGVRTNAMRPSRGGRLIVTPASISRLQVS